jgi:hypothetical protein
LEEADLPEAYFDLVTMNQLIEHLWEPRKCLLMVRRILSDQGKLNLTTPDIRGYDRQLLSQGLWGGYYFPRHLNFFNRKHLISLLASCGLKMIESRNLVAPVVWCYSLKAWAKKNFPSAYNLHSFFDVHNMPLMAVFTVLDLIAITAKVPTSNQEVVARAVSGFDAH